MCKLYFNTHHASLNAIRTAHPDRLHRTMVLSKFNVFVKPNEPSKTSFQDGRGEKTDAKANVRRGETSGSDATHHTNEIIYYPLYMTMFV